MLGSTLLHLIDHRLCELRCRIQSHASSLGEIHCFINRDNLLLGWTTSGMVIFVTPVLASSSRPFRLVSQTSLKTGKTGRTYLVDPNRRDLLPANQLRLAW